jgi:hypothetical protein
MKHRGNNNGNSDRSESEFCSGPGFKIGRRQWQLEAAFSLVMAMELRSAKNLISRASPHTAYNRLPRQSCTSLLNAVLVYMVVVVVSNARGWKLMVLNKFWYSSIFIFSDLLASANVRHVGFAQSFVDDGVDLWVPCESSSVDATKQTSLELCLPPSSPRQRMSYF